MVGKKKEDIVTFKTDTALAEELNKLPNKSEFIRKALLHALGNDCPLCNGSGTLTPNQRKHWEKFTDHHRATKCGTCNEIHLTCDAYAKIRH